VPPMGSPHYGLRFARCFARFAPTCGSRAPTPYDIMFPKKMCSKSSLQAAHAPPPHTTLCFPKRCVVRVASRPLTRPLPVGIMFTKNAMHSNNLSSEMIRFASGSEVLREPPVGPEGVRSTERSEPRKVATRSEA
jgi:hypothetical protein